MRVHEFLENWDARLVLGEPTRANDAMVFSAAIDSRKVKPGAAFFAARASALMRCPDTGALVRKPDLRVGYVQQAIDNGAQLIVVEPDFDLDQVKLDPYVTNKIFVACVDNPMRVFAELDIHLNPLPALDVFGVTGTNGKSSTVGIARDVLRHLGAQAFSIGTLGVIGDAPVMQLPDILTTPEAAVAHDIFRQLHRTHNATHVVTEVSSQGMVEERYGAVQFKVMAFTNFSQDHLDYHTYDYAADVIDADGAMDRYFAAKLRALIEQTAPQACVVLNCEMDRFDDLMAAITAQRPDLTVTTYGSAASGADLTYQIEASSLLSQSVNFVHDGQAQRVDLPLLGGFQAENAACAVAMAMAARHGFEAATRALAHVRQVPGRMQHVRTTPNNGRVFIDYAHSPDAINRVVENFKSGASGTAGHLALVIGCGGDRDPTKRAVMAQAAAGADAVYVTDDNPRTETASAIRAQVMAGLRACGHKRCANVAGRAQAIAQAVHDLPAGGTLVICGKGHEDYQEIRATDDPTKTMRVPFSDLVEARRALADLAAAARVSGVDLTAQKAG